MEIVKCETLSANHLLTSAGWSLSLVRWLISTSGGAIVDHFLGANVNHTLIQIHTEFFANGAASGVPVKDLGWLVSCICNQRVLI